MRRQQRDLRAQDHEGLGADDRVQPSAVDDLGAADFVEEGEHREAEIDQHQPEGQRDQPHEQRGRAEPAQIDPEGEDIGRRDDREE